MPSSTIAVGRFLSFSTSSRSLDGRPAVPRDSRSVHAASFDRGVTVLITYQAHATLKRVYGDATANIVGLCANVIYLRQADVDSAKYAPKDLGWERG